MRYKTNKPHVIYEKFDDEVVLINLKSGNYYSLDSVGAEIWGGIENGDEVGGIVAAIQCRFSGEADLIEKGVRRFLDEMLQEGLIATEEKPAGGHSQPLPGPLLERPLFSAPILHRYTDMQDLLLLDPIHEVDESGWPKREPDGNEPQK